MIGRWIAFALILGLLGGVFYVAVKKMMPDKSVLRLSEYEPWPDEVVEAARAIPIHNGGRVKPLETFAGYMMLSFRGDRTIRIIGSGEGKTRIGPTEWLLDTLFRPEVSMKLPTFRVDNSDVFETIGMEGKEKRDRYSYEELDPYRARLFEVGAEFEGLQEKGFKLSTVQKQTRELASNVRSYEALLGYFSFARNGVEFQGFGENGESERKPVSVVMTMAPVLQEAIERARTTGEMPPRLKHILQQVTDLSNFSRYGLAVIPPQDADEEEWVTAGNLIWGVTTGTVEDPETAVGDIVAMEEVVYALASDKEGKGGEFAAKLKKWQGSLEERARSRGEYRAIPTELSYNRANWFFRATFLAFVPACLFLVLSWLAPKSTFARIMTILVWVGSVSGLSLIVMGTIQRVIITQRPPVTGLYDTIPFITAMVIIIAIVAECLTRRRVAIGVAPIVGFVGLVLARLYDFGDASDPNDPLIAVLRSNFWLTIHVLTITFGYAAGFLTAAFGLVYMFMRILKLDGGDKSTRRVLTRMTYGCVCFTLFLSLVGTVLGGIWANYSWGRFWGWDPKENGALLIVIWMLFVLHARMGGIIKEWGTNLCAIFGAMVVTFSWWHVNLLGVGLHSYGFSESKKQAVFMFYGLMVTVLLIGIGFAAYDYFAARGKKMKRGEVSESLPEGMPAK